MFFIFRSSCEPKSCCFGRIANGGLHHLYLLHDTYSVIFISLFFHLFIYLFIHDFNIECLFVDLFGSSFIH